MVNRSYLYVPGNRPDRFPKAVSSGADAVIVDLEDAVGAEEKAQARAAAARWLSEAPAVPVWIRVNNSHGLLVDDLAMVAGSRAAGAVIPKVTVDACDAAAVPVQALIETAAGVQTVARIALHPRVVRLALGEADLCAELGVDPAPDMRELWAIRSDVVVASAAAGLEPPVGPAATVMDDADALERTSRQLRRQGFGARSIVHPSQIAAVHAAFTPSEEEISGARRLVEAFVAAGGGPTIVDGRFVDRATARLAQRVLDEAEP